MTGQILKNEITGRGDKGFWLLLALSAVVWVIVTSLIAPLAGDTDVYIFKDAGCSLALGQGFTSLGLPGSADFQRHLFASYAPGLPLLFGGAASVFGCSAGTNSFFTLAVGFAASVATGFALLPRIAPRFKLACGFLLGLAAPAGFVTISPDRPEALGLAGFVIVCLLAGSGKRPFSAAFAAGMVALCYPFGGMLSGVAAWCLAAGGCSWRDLPSKWRTLSSLALLQFAVYLIPILSVAAIYAILDPTAAGRFGGHAFGSDSGLGAVLQQGYLTLLASSAFNSGPYSLSLALSAGLAALLVLGAAGFEMARAEKDRDLILPFLLLAFVLATLALPGQNNAMAWVRSALPVLLATSSSPIAVRMLRRPIVPLLVALVCCANLPFLTLNIVIRAQSIESYHLAQEAVTSYAARLARSEGAEAAPDALVLVPEAVYFLYKPALLTLTNPAYLPLIAEANPPIRGLAACSYGVLAGTRPEADSALIQGLEPVAKIGDHMVPKLFGFSISHREWGMSCDQYAAL